MPTAQAIACLSHNQHRNLLTIGKLFVYGLCLAAVRMVLYLAGICSPLGIQAHAAIDRIIETPSLIALETLVLIATNKRATLLYKFSTRICDFVSIVYQCGIQQSRTISHIFYL